MGNSLREVKMRMVATKKTSQITKAMNMVSAAKLRHAEKTYTDYQGFMNQIVAVVKNIVGSSDGLMHPMLVKRTVKKTGFIVITSDRGLAGPYNSAVLKKLSEEITNRNLAKENFEITVIGTRGYGYCKKKGYNLTNDEPMFVRDDVQFIDIVEKVKALIEKYQNGYIDELIVCYNHYVNTITQEAKFIKILPIETDLNTNLVTEYEYDQGKEKTLDLILPMYVENMLYGLILDAKTSEHAARMTAMKSATDNACDVIDALQLVYNRTRQAAITNELTDIIGGANAVE